MTIVWYLQNDVQRKLPWDILDAQRKKPVSSECTCGVPVKKMRIATQLSGSACRLDLNPELYVLKPITLTTGMSTQVAIITPQL